MELLLLGIPGALFAVLVTWIVFVDPEQHHAATYWLCECILGCGPVIVGLGAGIICDCASINLYDMEPTPAFLPMTCVLGQSGIAAGVWLIVVRYRNRIRE